TKTGRLRTSNFGSCSMPASNPEPTQRAARSSRRQLRGCAGTEFPTGSVTIGRMSFAPGQRWISTAEPELGLGTVLRVEGRTVQLAFPASGVVRHYAQQMAPLTRAEFRPGERVSGGGQAFVVERVERDNGVLCYFGNGVHLREGELDDVQNVSKADARLIAGR